MLRQRHSSQAFPIFEPTAAPPDSGPSCNSAQTMRRDPSDPTRRDGGFPQRLSGLGIKKTKC
jgi:hypothetical protein